MFNKALKELGGHITIHDLQCLLQKHFKDLRLVLKNHGNGRVVRTDKIIGFLLTKKGRGYLFLRDSSTYCIAIDVNCQVIMETYVGFAGIKKLSKQIDELRVNPKT